MKGIIIMIIVSMFMPTLFWNQSLGLTYRVTAYHFVFLYYFILLKYNVTEKEILSVLIFYGIVYALLWLVALSYVPIPVFSDDEEIREDRGTFRIIIASFDIIMLLYFWALANLKKRTKILLSIIIIVPCIVFTVTNLTRAIWAAVILVSLYMVFAKTKLSTKIISLVAVVAMFPVLISVFSRFAQNNEVLSTITEMTEMQLTEMSDMNEDNSETRLVEYRIGFTDYERNPVTFLVGSGRAHIFSDFGRYEQNLRNTYKFDRSDAGYPAIFVTYGLIGLLIFLGLFLKIIRDKNDKASPYKMYLIVIIAINLMQDATTWYGIATSIAIYLMEKNRLSSLEKKKSVIAQPHAII